MDKSVHPLLPICMEIVLCHRAYEEMVNHLLSVYPEEGCGIVGQRGSLFCRHYPIENILHSTVAYQMEPQQQIRALLAVNPDDEQKMVLYHSHPQSSPVPSPTDLQQAYYPDSYYLIVSLRRPSQPESRAYRLQQGEFHEVGLRIK